MKSEREKMLAGELYLASDPELVDARLRARRLMFRYNNSSPDDPAARGQILSELFASVGPRVEIEPPIACDYGFNVSVGAGAFMNFGCVLLDCNRITIGEGTLLGPGVHIYAATHPVDPGVRSTLREMAFPVSVGRNVWIGGGAIICPGVSIGDDAVIGAGSVVTRDIPARVVAFGNPCRVVRSVGPEDLKGRRSFFEPPRVDEHPET